MLIWIQKPEAKYVTSLHKYNKMGYAIKSGAKSIKILAPNTYNIVKQYVDVIKINEVALRGKSQKINIWFCICICKARQSGYKE